MGHAMSDEGTITRLLREVEAGVPDAQDRLFHRVYDELKSMAAARVARERQRAADGGATDILHEAYRRLADEQFKNRKHLFFAYARAMRQILVDRARRNNAIKRGGGGSEVGDGIRGDKRAQIPLDSKVSGSDDDERTIAGPIEIAEVIEKLRGLSEREAAVVELRYFGGLADHDIAEVLDISERTVRNDWASAKQRLQGWLG